MQSGHTDSANFEECEISFFALGYFAPPAGISYEARFKGTSSGTNPSQKVYFHDGRSIPPGGPDLLRGPPVSGGLSRPVEPAGRQGRDADRPRPVIRRLRPGFSVQSKAGYRAALWLRWSFDCALLDNQIHRAALMCYVPPLIWLSLPQRFLRLSLDNDL